MIGVCIKYFHHNYGGMLQALATVSFLESKNIDYELIRYQKHFDAKTIIRFLPRLLNRTLLNDKYEALLKKAGEKTHPDFAKENAVREAAFDSFEKAHFTKLSPVFEGYESLCENAKRYNAVITGSDQLWSPSGLPTNFYNLMFVPDDITKISLASSFGVSNIPWYQKRRTAEYLNRIEHVSMRETRGSEIVCELTGRKVPTVLDPVLFYDKEGWQKLLPFEKEFDEKYIFAYFLGSNPDYRKAVEKAAKQLSCKIVTLRHLDRYNPYDESFGDVALYDVSPHRFLNLLRGAEYVCTDSFHGSCFSLLHEKSFVVFNRYSDASKHSKNSRISSLCRNLGLNERRYNENEDLTAQLTAAIDYTAVFEKLAAMKEETQNYIDNALKDAVL